ncbi:MULTISPECIES: CBS domain-containing protein [Mesorhizobium]|nr:MULTISPECIES: CBS domain-containing protein [Mesorhizobium]AMX97534.1 histidine kinase [Mesorhizobium ciceri]MBZ9887702.1 CBS domain-containing protein [Mesorhizobium sp. BR1-1-3]MDF3233645.1 CBS domain-containing protein [Mesorhizobium sp. DSM 30133]RUU16305.1 CBS domain-containing protein [Mesorhizobium sp. Primo-B]RUU34119.1 CBS domain-containing protein [Mesorhizobium sp. Primo-A]
MQAKTIMTTAVVAIDPSASIADAAGLMLSSKISGLPVIRRDGALVGIISEGDLLRREELGTQRKRPRWLEFLVSPGRVAEEYVLANGRRIEEVMTDSVVTASPNASLAEVVELMTHHRIKRVPIVDGDKVVGMIARSDLLRALLDMQPASTPMAIDNEQIRQSIVAELAAQKWARNELINVTVDKGIVKLNGAIFDERERRAAIVAAENAAGVKGVEDNLFCAEPLSVILVS